MGKVITRLSPSPTGKLHIGNVHTFLFNYCFAKHVDGEVLLRIEDTDQERNKPEFIDDIKESLTWLGLKWDGDVKLQSENKGVYQKYAEQLIASGDAYYCYHTKEELDKERKEQEARGQAPRYSGTCQELSEEKKDKYIKEGRKPAIRFRMTGEGRPKSISYKDLVYGDISYDPADIGDFVIIRSDGSVLYNFGNVIDDHEMAITHVIRGQSHLTNTPRQILIYEALGWEIPQFGHLPEVLNPDRVGKLSKRYGASSVSDFRNEGYLPQALINFLGSLGWSHPSGKEFFDLPDMIWNFSFERVRKAPAAIDLNKLDFYNAHYLKNLPEEEFSSFIKNELGVSDSDLIISQIVPLLRDRVSNRKDIHRYADYFFKDQIRPEYEFSKYSEVLSLALSSLKQLDSWDKEKIESNLRNTQENSEIKPRDFFVTLGQAISGDSVFLPIFDSLEILGKEKVLTRLQQN